VCGEGGRSLNEIVKLGHWLPSLPHFLIPNPLSDKSRCRNRERAEELCQALGQGSKAVDLAAVASGEVSGDVLINSTAVGMQPAVDATLVPKEGLTDYTLVFDAVYTPLETQLLKVGHLYLRSTAAVMAATVKKIWAWPIRQEPEPSTGRCKHKN